MELKTIKYKNTTYASLADLARAVGKSYNMLFNRIKIYGWSVETAVETPRTPRKKLYAHYLRVRKTPEWRRTEYRHCRYGVSETVIHDSYDLDYSEDSKLDNYRFVSEDSNISLKCPICGVKTYLDNGYYSETLESTVCSNCGYY